MNEEEYKKEINKLKANLRYYKIVNKEQKKQNTFLRYEKRLLETKIDRLNHQQKENSYLIIELIKKKENK